MNILFAGSPDSAAKVLDSLSNESNINIKAVITQPDKRGKRGSKLIAVSYTHLRAHET